MGLLDSIIGAAPGSAQGTAAPGAAGGMDAQQLMAVVAQLLHSAAELAQVVELQADSREQYDAAHNALREHPEVKWTL